MKATRISLIAMVGLLLIPRTAPAPIFGPFENLNALIDGAEFIVVAEIVKRPDQTDFGGGGTYEIEVEWVIKGDVKSAKRYTAYLRDLPFGNGRETSSVTQCFIPGTRYVLFLNKPGGFHDEHGKPLPVDFECENFAGDAVWLSSCSESPTGYFDLERLKGKSVRESIVALLNHSATEQQRYVNGARAMIESRGSIIPTQTIAHIVWLKNNTREAADFYLSVFKEARRDPNLDEVRDISKQRFTGERLWIGRDNIVLLNRGPKWKPAEVTRLTVNCDTQEDINYYWEKLSAGGEKSKGGWVKDKFGVWWHIVPSDLWLLLGGKYGDPERVMKAMMEMDLIDILALRRAARGD